MLVKLRNQLHKINMDMDMDMNMLIRIRMEKINVLISKNRFIIRLKVNNILNRFQRKKSYFIDYNASSDFHTT